MTKEFIIRLRELSGLSIAEFAYKVNVADATVRKWESGQSEPLFINQKTIRYHFPNEVKKIQNEL